MNFREEDKNQPNNERKFYKKYYCLGDNKFFTFQIVLSCSYLIWNIIAMLNKNPESSEFDKKSTFIDWVLY